MNEINNKIYDTIYVNMWDRIGNILFKNVNSFIVINSPSNNTIPNRLLKLNNIR
jgi:hypothetical protein